MSASHEAEFGTLCHALLAYCQENMLKHDVFSGETAVRFHMQCKHSGYQHQVRKSLDALSDADHPCS